MKYVIYRKNISFKSGTGQLIGMQIDKLRKYKLDFSVYCKTGIFNILLKKTVLAKKAKINKNKLHVSDRNSSFIIDHDTSLTNADITFIHNIPVENNKNSNYFTWLKSSNCTIVANSNYTKKILIDNGYKENNISIVYPGYNKEIFNLDSKRKHRTAARKSLGIKDNEKVIGFITSGDFEKRGLDYFLEICEQLRHRHNIKFFIMGSKKIPDKFKSHEIINSEQFIYKPKNSTPDYWLSAMDIFLYPARFEEFGMVIPEALSMGLPVITTRNVGASEILTKAFDDWLSDNINISWFVERVSALLDDDKLYQTLSNQALSSLSYNDEDYATRTINLINQIASHRD
ncbi:glycosyltransferase family 4 protein [Vibrio furnissii]|uniref:glycosyltransferase family 4 protein n=1 Tax=Vibrio furnissii TaxID=29494 RepID=UPI00399A7762